MIVEYTPEGDTVILVVYNTDIHCAWLHAVTL